MNRSLISSLCLACALALPAILPAADSWHNFRGPTGTGVSEETDPAH